MNKKNINKIFCCLNMTLALASYAFSNISIGPILQPGTNKHPEEYDAKTIIWESEQNIENVSIEIKGKNCIEKETHEITLKKSTVISDSTKRYLYKAKVKNLDLDKNYFYRIFENGQQIFESSFQTLPQHDNLKIVIIGGNGYRDNKNSESLKKIILEIDKVKPHAIVYTGGFIDLDSNRDQLKDAFDKYKSLMSQYPFYIHSSDFRKGLEFFHTYYSVDLSSQLHLIVLDPHTVSVQDANFHLIWEELKEDLQKAQDQKKTVFVSMNNHSCSVAINNILALISNNSILKQVIERLPDYQKNIQSLSSAHEFIKLLLQYNVHAILSSEFNITELTKPLALKNNQFEVDFDKGTLFCSTGAGYKDLNLPLLTLIENICNSSSNKMISLSLQGALLHSCVPLNSEQFLNDIRNKDTVGYFNYQESTFMVIDIDKENGSSSLNIIDHNGKTLHTTHIKR